MFFRKEKKTNKEKTPEEEIPSKELSIKGDTLLAEQMSPVNSILASLSLKDFLNSKLLEEKAKGLSKQVAEIFWKQICTKFITSYDSPAYDYKIFYLSFFYDLEFDNHPILTKIFVEPHAFYESLTLDSLQMLRQLLVAVNRTNADILLNKILDQMAFFNFNHPTNKKSVPLIQEVFATDNFFITCFQSTYYKHGNECRDHLISIHEKFNLEINLDQKFALKYITPSIDSNDLTALKFIFKIIKSEVRLPVVKELNESLFTERRRSKDIIVFLAEMGVKHPLWRLAEEHTLSPIQEQNKLLEAKIKALEEKVKQLETDCSQKLEI